MVKEDLAQIWSRITEVCQRIGRDSSDITLVAVTKYTTLEKMHEAIVEGIRHIGENRVQEAEEKFAALGSDAQKVKKHMIGHLQTNKVKKALALFDMLQSVDSEKLALEIEKQAASLNRTIEILIEVNTSGEEQKFGVAKENAVDLLEKIAQCPHIKVSGFMTMAPYTDNTDIVRNCFKDLKDLSVEIAEKFKNNEKIEMKYLSMGMTGDFEIALEEGANMLRIGSAIFSGVAS